MILSTRRDLDLLNGTIWDKILKIALPLAATGMLQQAFNAADVAVVGRFVGKDAMAAVGSNSPIIGLLINCFLGIALGTNVKVAHAIGAKNDGAIRRTVSTSVIFALFGGVILAVVGELLAPWALRTMKVPEEIIGMSGQYLRIYFLGIPIIGLYNFEAAIFRAKGDTQTPLYVLLFSGALNLGLNVLFVVAFDMSVKGVALATLLSNLVSASVLFILLTRAEGAVKLDLKHLVFDLKILGGILRIGLPAGVQSSMFSVANVMIQSIINSLGTTVMAGSSAAFNVEVIACYLFDSFASACTTMVGQCRGANDVPRARRALWTALGLDAIALTSVGLLMFIFASPLMSIFNEDPGVVANGVIRLRYILIAYIFSMISGLFSGYLRGSGTSLPSAIVAIVSIVGVRMLWVWLVYPLNPCFETLMFVYPISLCLNAAGVVTYFLLTRKRKGY